MGRKEERLKVRVRWPLQHPSVGSEVSRSPRQNQRHSRGNRPLRESGWKEGARSPRRRKRRSDALRGPQNLPPPPFTPAPSSSSFPEAQHLRGLPATVCCYEREGDRSPEVRALTSHRSGLTHTRPSEDSVGLWWGRELPPFTGDNVSSKQNLYVNLGWCLQWSRAHQSLMKAPAQRQWGCRRPAVCVQSAVNVCHLCRRGPEAL